MTALTLPRCVVTYTAGHAYPFRSDLPGESATLLLYASYLDPMAADDGAVITAVHSELSDTHSTQHARLVYAIDLDRDAEVANARMRACTVRACRLCAVAP